MANDIQVVSIDYPAILARLTDTKPADWNEADGPDSGVGVDYWYNGPNGEVAYANLDQSHLEISVENEGKLDIDLDEAPDDHWIRQHVSCIGSSPTP
jgi:hypothetical protein